MRTIAIAGVDSRAGRSAMLAARRSPNRYRVVGFCCDTFCPQPYECDTVHLVANSYDSPTVLENILECVERERPSLLICARESLLPQISAQKSEFKRLGCEVPIGTSAAVSSFVDAYLTSETLRRLGIPAPRSWCGGNIDKMAADCCSPIVVKPRRGGCSNNVHVFTDINQVIDLLEGNSELIAQEYISQDPEQKPYTSDSLLVQKNEYSAQGIISQNKRLLASFSSVNELWKGVPIIVRPENSADFRRLTSFTYSKLAEHGVVGPVNIQAKQCLDGNFKVFDVNLRPTGITAMRALMGFNEIDLLFSSFVLHEHAVTIREPIGMIGFRHWEDILVDESQPDRLLQSSTLP